MFLDLTQTKNADTFMRFVSFINFWLHFYKLFPARGEQHLHFENVICRQAVLQESLSLQHKGAHGC